MAEDLATTAGRAPTPVPAVELPRRRRALHRGRFLVAYAVVALLAAAGLAAAYVVATADRVPGTAWSSWEPTGDERTRPQEIADHVGRRYRLPDGAQLVGIVAGPPVVQDVEVRAVAIQEPTDTSAEDIDVFPADKSLMYVLCGLGSNCAIRTGEPTEERHRLLRREALEAALLTFKFVDDVDSVIALLPPPADTESNGTALFFEKRDFRRELDRPLRETLAAPGPDGAFVAVAEGEAITVDRLTRPRLFGYQFQAAQDGSAIMVLSPVSG